MYGKIDYNSFKNYVLDTPGLKFFFYKTGMYVNAKIKSIEDLNEGLKLKFEGGEITIWNDKKIQEIPRPSMLIVECERCFSLFNEYDEHIGDIYKAKDEKKYPEAEEKIIIPESEREEIYE